jgi:hypothetical protein
MKDAGCRTVKDLDNKTQKEYLIGSEAKIVLPKSHQPNDRVL